MRVFRTPAARRLPIRPGARREDPRERCRHGAARPRRTRAGAGAVVWALVLGALAGPAPAQATPLLPDIVADAPVPVGQPEVYADGQGQRLLLRMTGYVHNAGRGALEIRGTSPTAGPTPTMTSVVQRVYDDAGGHDDLPHAPSPLLIFETADGHSHWHVRSAMRFSLWTTDRAREVAPSQKVGFCLADVEAIEPWAPTAAGYVADGPAAQVCARFRPAAASVLMGISAGWRDRYLYSLTFQWIDVSSTAPGVYVMRADADPDGVFAEAEEDNAPTYARSTSTVPGYVAQPVDAGEIAAETAPPIELRAQAFGSPGAAQYAIVRPPAHGTLDQPTGTWFSSAQVRYRPDAGFSGPDDFTYAVRDATSPFPLQPLTAAVTLTSTGAPAPDPAPRPEPAPPPVPAPAPVAALAISGAPAAVLTGSRTQLTATGPGAAGGVAWSVGGLGGPAGVGAISADGVYSAPALAPLDGHVVVGARNEAGTVAEARIAIVAAPVARPAPSVTPQPTPRTGRLSPIRLARHGRRLIASVTAARAGRVVFVARAGGRRIGRCAVRARRGVPATCSMALPRTVAPRALACRLPRTKDLRLPAVRVTAKLYSQRGRLLAQRTRSAR